MKIANIMTTTFVAGAAFVAGRQDPTPQPPRQPPDAAMLAMMQASTPSEHHRHLEALAGEWNVAFEMRMSHDEPMMGATGTVTRDWVLGGRYLREFVDAEFPGAGPFQGMGMLGYNNMDGRYEAAFVSNHATHIHFETGTYDATRKVMTFRSEPRDPATGRIVDTWGELDMSDPDRQQFAAWSIGPDGAAFKNFEAVFERR